MTLADLITQVHYAYKGNTRVPVSGDVKYTLYLGIANRKIREWARDPNNHWASLYDGSRTIGTVASGTQTYDLDEDFISPSDQIFAETSATSYFEMDVIKAPLRHQLSNGVFISSFDPPKLTFADTIGSTSSLVGRTIRVPGYYMPEELVSPSDFIPVDNPDWLVYATAAELARNDAAKTDQFPNLIGLANEEYRKMVENNQNSSFEAPNAVANNMPLIGETW